MKRIKLVLTGLFLSVPAFAAITYDTISYTTFEQVKIGDTIVSNPYSFSQADPYLEQSGGATASLSFCQAYGSWRENESIEPFLGQIVDVRASMTLRFQPYGSQIEIYGSGGIYEPPFGAAYDFTLTDLTTAQMITEPSGIYDIDPAHIYELYLYAGTTLEDPSKIYNGAQIEVSFFITPEPGTLALLAAGMFCGTGKRKR